MKSKNHLNLLFVLFWFSLSLSAQNSLKIPDTLAGPVYHLDLHSDSVQFLPGKKTMTYGFNNNSYLGPTIILRKNTTADITVTNSIGDTTTLHWHGLHVSPENDGGPHSPILPGSKWHPVFQVMNKAATYWYHPHMHKETAKHAMKGAAGMIIIRDQEESSLALPRYYGVDDFPLIVQSQEFDSLNQINYRGMRDSFLLVNGQLNPYLNIPAQVVRFRVLNASQERNYNFGFTNNLSFYVIANDGGLLESPIKTTRIRLAPGERAEILVNTTGMEGKSFYLMSYASEIPMGVQGGPTMPMPNQDHLMDSPLNGINFNILQLVVGNSTSNGIQSIPGSLTSYAVLKEADANYSRTIDFTADNDTVMDGPFYFNGKSFDMMRVDYNIPLDNIEVWTLRNLTMVAHPFHIHDVQFFILDRDGNMPPKYERGYKDVVLVSPNETVRIIMKFEDFADTTTPYMFHCHILMHEDDGMMGQFMVVPKNSSLKEGNVKDNSFLYPNPVTDVLRVSLLHGNRNSKMDIFDDKGILIFEANNLTDMEEINTSQWHKGIYIIAIQSGDIWERKKFIVQ